MPPRAPRNLRHFGKAQPPLPSPVELVERCKCDVRNVHIEAHADGIGCHEIIDFARLIHCDLRVARAWTERAHDHRRATARAAEHLGDRINFLAAEGDDDRAFGQSRQFFRACITQRGKPRTLDDFCIGDQRAHHRAQGLGTKDHRFLAPAHIEHPVGEDMPALGVRTQLRLIECGKGHIAFPWHRFCRAQQPACAGWHDLFLARDQADFLWPLDRDHAVINLASEQTQRETDHSAGMATQSLNGEMRLARIRRAEHGFDGRGRIAAHPPKLAPRCADASAVSCRRQHGASRLTPAPYPHGLV